MIHELKTDTIVFQEAKAGLKPFEIRFDDRGYSVGDTLVLNETKYSAEEMREGLPLEYTGEKIVQKVTCITRNYGLVDGWVIMGTKNEQCNLSETHLCQFCFLDFSTCPAKDVVFGCGEGNDNVVFCNSRQVSFTARNRRA